MPLIIHGRSERPGKKQAEKATAESLQVSLKRPQTHKMGELSLWRAAEWGSQHLSQEKLRSKIQEQEAVVAGSEQLKGAGQDQSCGQKTDEAEGPLAMTLHQLPAP